jgi:two-component system nitrate/nitrite response regulator NarL
MISVGVVNGDQMLLDGIAAWLRLAEGMRLAAAARTVSELLRNRHVPIDVVVLSLLLADRSDPFDNIRRLLASGSEVLALEGPRGGGSGRRALAAGASAYLTRDDGMDTLVAAVREIARADQHDPGRDDGEQPRRRPSLAPQERAVLVAYASGLTLDAAARQIGVQPVTAKNYLARVKEKYRQVGRPTFTKLDLAARVREDGL